MLTLKSIPRLDSSIVSRHMENEAVLVHPQRGKVKVLNEVGAEIWKLIDGQTTIEEIVDRLADRYPVDRKTLEADSLRFVSDLLDRDLISLDSSSAMTTG